MNRPTVALGLLVALCLLLAYPVWLWMHANDGKQAALSWSRRQVPGPYPMDDYSGGEYMQEHPVRAGDFIAGHIYTCVPVAEHIQGDHRPISLQFHYKCSPEAQ